MIYIYVLILLALLTLWHSVFLSSHLALKIFSDMFKKSGKRWILLCVPFQGSFLKCNIASHWLSPWQEWSLHFCKLCWSSKSTVSLLHVLLSLQLARMTCVQQSGIYCMGKWLHCMDYCRLQVLMHVFTLDCCTKVPKCFVLCNSMSCSYINCS